jgi:hypothetical protein
MAEVIEKVSDAAGSSSTARREGTASAGSAGVPATRPNPPAVLTPAQFRKIGSTLNGKHWQADIGQLIGISRSQVTRYLKAEREMNALVPKHLQFVVVERIAQLAALLDLPGMPYAGSERIKGVISQDQRRDRHGPRPGAPAHRRDAPPPGVA